MNCIKDGIMSSSVTNDQCHMSLEKRHTVLITNNRKGKRKYITTSDRLLWWREWAFPACDLSTKVKVFLGDH